MGDRRRECPTCGRRGLCDGRGRRTFLAGVWLRHPIAVQTLGVCSALAVTTRVENALVMGAALAFVCIFTNLAVSLLRAHTPRRIRMIAEVAIIATFVIVFDLLLKATYWDMSRRLGPYVGLIITNCIIMGRAEAFALQNRPILAIVDGAANGLGYAIVLGAAALARELLGTGGMTWAGRTLFRVEGYPANHLLILAPGAFIVLGLLIALYNALSGHDGEDAA